MTRSQFPVVSIWCNLNCILDQSGVCIGRNEPSDWNVGGFWIFLPRNVQRKDVTFLHRRTSYRRALFERLYFLLLCRVVSFPLGWNSERKPDGKIADCNLESGIRNRAFYSKHNLERDRPLGWGWTNWKIDRVIMKFWSVKVEAGHQRAAPFPPQSPPICEF